MRKIRARSRAWQLDALRARRDRRLAENTRQRRAIWADYNRAVAAISTPLVEAMA